MTQEIPDMQVLQEAEKISTSIQKEFNAVEPWKVPGTIAQLIFTSIGVVYFAKEQSPELLLPTLAYVAYLCKILYNATNKPTGT